jgi:hypothetical protein
MIGCSKADMLPCPLPGYLQHNMPAPVYDPETNKKQTKLPVNITTKKRPPIFAQQAIIVHHTSYLLLL